MRRFTSENVKMETLRGVETQIEDGQRLIDQLIRDGIEVTAAFWVRTSEEGLPQLYIASPSFNPDKMGEAFRDVYASLNTLTDCAVTPADLLLIDGANPIARAAVALRDRHSGRSPTRYHGQRLGSLPVVEATIYPPPGQWFPGFDEIKHNFPSAEAFTIPVLSADASPAKLAPFLGTINAERFQGRPSGTVLFQGPKESRGQPRTELCFVYKPEGWNTLYRADTRTYEEVRHVSSGAPFYRLADFGPWAALKIRKGIVPSGPGAS